MTLVYTTNTGSTERYAHMLSEKTGMDCVALSDADSIASGEEVIYMGWVMMGEIQGLAAARTKLNIKAVCAVGMMSGEKNENDIKEKSSITEPFFFLQGAFDLSKLKGMYKMMMGMTVRMMKAKLKDSTDPAELKAMELFEQGFDMVKEENLAPILEWLA